MSNKGKEKVEASPPKKSKVEDPFIEKATAVLRKGLQNEKAILTEKQKEVIRALVVDEKDVLYLDRTGAGKSETYFVSTKLMREDPTAGPVIVVTPLVSLIHDQVRRAKKFGLNAIGYFSTGKGMTAREQDKAVLDIAKNKTDLLFLTAEMLQQIATDINPTSKQPHKILDSNPQLKKNRPKQSDKWRWHYIPLLVIDEIHYVSDAGHDFRPAYRQVWLDLAEHLWFKRACKLGLTATFNDRVQSSLTGVLPDLPTWEQILGTLYRDNIRLRVIEGVTSDAARIEWVQEYALENKDLAILVFVKRRDDAKQWSQALRGAGIAAGYYYSCSATKDLEDYKAVTKHEQDFREGEIQVLFSTNALGLGYDKSDIPTVIHTWTPNTMVQYYQEFGRAGRQPGLDATAYMLPTRTWDATKWIDCLSKLAFLLSRTPNKTLTRNNIKEYAISTRLKETDMNIAIVQGLQKTILVEREIHKITLHAEGLLVLDKIYAQHIKCEVEAMRLYSHNGSSDSACLWRFVLQQFKCEPIGDGFCCGKCSGQRCAPGGDIAPDPLAAENLFFQTTTPKGVTVYALSKAGETVDWDEERVAGIFAAHRPSMVSDPPGKWTLIPIPDSKGENLTKAEQIAPALGDMPISNSYVYRISDEKVTGCGSAGARKQILEKKFKFGDISNENGSILLLDDNSSSGDTIDWIAAPFRAKGLTVIALVGEVFEVKGKVITQLKIRGQQDPAT